MHPVLMTPSGIPRSGLVAWHDLYDPTESLASVPDLSGNGYSLQLGSTAGADTNDPAWGTDGKGLVFTTDDYCLTDTLSGVDLGDPWTAILVAYPKTLTAWASVVWSLAAGVYGVGVRAQGAGNLAFRRIPAGDGESVPVVYDQIQTFATICDGSKYRLLRLDTGDDGELVGVQSGASPRIGIGYFAFTTATAIVPEAVAYSHLFWDRALSTAEIQRVYRSLKATWAARGVTIL